MKYSKRKSNNKFSRKNTLKHKKKSGAGFLSSMASMATNIGSKLAPVVGKTALNVSSKVAPVLGNTAAKYAPAMSNVATNVKNMANQAYAIAYEPFCANPNSTSNINNEHLYPQNTPIMRGFCNETESIGCEDAVNDLNIALNQFKKSGNYPDDPNNNTFTLAYKILKTIYRFRYQCNMRYKTIPTNEIIRDHLRCLSRRRDLERVDNVFSSYNAKDEEEFLKKPSQPTKTQMGGSTNRYKLCKTHKSKRRQRGGVPEMFQNLLGNQANCDNSLQLKTNLDCHNFTYDNKGKMKRLPGLQGMLISLIIWYNRKRKLTDGGVKERIRRRYYLSKTLWLISKIKNLDTFTPDAIDTSVVFQGEECRPK